MRAAGAVGRRKSVSAAKDVLESTVAQWLGGLCAVSGLRAVRWSQGYVLVGWFGADRWQQIRCGACR